MADPTVSKIETAAQAQGNKAIAWLKVHWYAFLIGAAAGALAGHLLWK